MFCPSPHHAVRLAAAFMFLAAFSATAHAQRGASNYVAEVEPHLVVQWTDEPVCGDDGIGVGGRASFPVMPQGPIPSIANNLSLGVGLDVAFFDGDCAWGRFYDDNIDATSIWVPFDVQWNFFFTESFSAFVELGLGIEHSSWDWNCPNDVCDDSDTDVELVLWLGGRYHFTRSMAVTLRLGKPSLLFGVSFFM